MRKKKNLKIFKREKKIIVKKNFKIKKNIIISNIKNFFLKKN